MSVATPASRIDEPAHLPALDGLRALAIVLVLLHNFELPGALDGLAGKLFTTLTALGWVGVQLFFVLSGFLITRQLLAMQWASNYYASFFGRRVLRIFPLYFGTLLLLTVVWPAVGGRPITEPGDSAVWLWLFLSNWTEPYGFGSGGLPHFWSLAVEEQFYLFWPFLVRRRSARSLLRVCLFIAAASVAWRIMAWGIAWPPMTNYTWTPARLDALALGAALAAAQALAPGHALFAPQRARHWWFGAVALGVLGLFASHGYGRLSPQGQIVGYTMLSLVFAMMVMAAALCTPGTQGAWGRLLQQRAATAVGRYSFAMYVFHKPLHDYLGLPLARAWSLDRAGLPGTLAYMAGASLATFVLARWSYWHFERRFLALKGRFSPR